jgi:hypothetical protein
VRALLVTGKDEESKAWTFKVPVGSHPEAAGWILEEARRRIRKRIEIERGVRKELPGAYEHAGQKLELEPLQVVGKKCAASGKVISYEPDARVCPQCERVYYKRSVPNKCKCGNAIGHLRPSTVTTPEDVTDDFVEGEDEVEVEVEEKEEEEETETTGEARSEDDGTSGDDDDDGKKSSKKVPASEDAES